MYMYVYVCMYCIYVHVRVCVLQNCSSWVLFNLAALYWRVAGEGELAVNCLKHALFHSGPSNKVNHYYICIVHVHVPTCTYASKKRFPVWLVPFNCSNCSVHLLFSYPSLFVLLRPFCLLCLRCKQMLPQVLSQEPLQFSYLPVCS